MTRVARALALWVVLFGPALGYLSTRQGPDLDTALTPDAVDTPAVPVEIGAGVRPLWRMGAGDLSGADRVDLLVATYGTHPRVSSADLRIGTCRFTLAAPRTMTDGDLLPLTRSGACTDASAASALIAIDASGGRLALWAWQRPAARATTLGGLSLTDPVAHPDAVSVLRGRVVVPWTSHTPRRASIVLWWWASAGWPVLVLVAIGLAAGLVGLLWLQSSRVAVGAGLLAGSVALLWALIIPPLQGADDPDHLLSLAEVASRPAMAAALPEFARLVHFERVRFHTHERFTTPDTRRPYPVAWTGDVHAERMESRSPMAVAIWRLVGGWLPDGNPAGVLLGLRVFNVGLFALVVAVAMRAVVRGGHDSAWAMVGATLMPTLPFFAGMISDWSYIVPWGLLTGAAILVVMRGGHAAPWAGVGLGVGGALLVSTSLGAWPAMPLIAAAAAGFLLLPGTERRRWVFWAGLGVGLLIALWLLRDLITVGYQRYDAANRASFAALLTWVNAGLTQMAQAPWLVMAVPLVLAGVDPFFTRMRSSPVVAGAVQSAGVLVITLVGGLAVATMATSLVWPLPTLPPVDPAAAGSIASDYVRQSLLALATTVRLTGFDFLTFTSLWGGFGWLDATLPPVMLAVVSAGLLGVVGVPAWSVRREAPGEAGWLLLIGLGTAVSLTAYAIAAAFMHRNLHGRYLLPLVIPALIAYGRPLGCWIARHPARAWTAAGLLALLHGASLWWVLQRYV